MFCTWARQTRECTYTGHHVGRFPWCCVWRFHLVAQSIHAETERPRVKKSRRRYISSNGKWKRKFCMCTRCATTLYFSSMHPVSTAAQSTTITGISQSKGQKIEAAKNNSSNRRPKHRSVKDRNVEGRNRSRYLSLLQYWCKQQYLDQQQQQQ